MGSSVRRKRMRLQVGVTKITCHLVDWPVSRGGRCFTWAARKQMKGLKSPSERKNYVGLWEGTTNRVAKILSRSTTLLDGGLLDRPRHSPPALPPRRRRTPNMADLSSMSRKLRHRERKFWWCTERANLFYSKNSRLARRITLGLPYASEDWYVKTKIWYHGFHRHAKRLGCTRDVLAGRSFKTIAQYALCEPQLTDFMKVFLAIGYEWDPDFIDTDLKFCICVHTPSGTLNINSCRVHKPPPLPKRTKVLKNGDRRRYRPTSKKREVDRFRDDCAHSGGQICRFCGRRVR